MTQPPPLRHLCRLSSARPLRVYRLARVRPVACRTELLLGTARSACRAQRITALLRSRLPPLPRSALLVFCSPSAIQRVGLTIARSDGMMTTFWTEDHKWCYLIARNTLSYATWFFLLFQGIFHYNNLLKLLNICSELKCRRNLFGTLNLISFKLALSLQCNYSWMCVSQKIELVSLYNWYLYKYLYLSILMQVLYLSS